MGSDSAIALFARRGDQPAVHATSVFHRTAEWKGLDRLHSDGEFRALAARDQQSDWTLEKNAAADSTEEHVRETHVPDENFEPRA